MTEWWVNEVVKWTAFGAGIACIPFITYCLVQLRRAIKDAKEADDD